MSQGASTRSWWLFGAVAVAVGVLLIIALNREPVELDPNTPEGTVQNYLQAVSDGDYKGAFNLIDPSSTEGCSPADLAAGAPSEPFAATLGDVTTEDNWASVRVSIREGVREPGPFGPGVGGYTEFFELGNETGQWMITGHAWPYFEFRCDTG
jgi:hypothetical protein